jgi:hypothetical protein
MSSGMKTRGSKKRAENQKSGDEVQNIYGGELEKQVEHLKTVVKTLASNFSDVKKSSARAMVPTVPTPTNDDSTSFAINENLVLQEQVSNLQHDMVALKSEISEVTYLLKKMLTEESRAEIRPMKALPSEKMTLQSSKLSKWSITAPERNSEMEYSFSSQIGENRHEKGKGEKSSSVRRKQQPGKQERSDDNSSVDTCSSSGGGKNSNVDIDEENCSGSLNGSEGSYNPSICESSVAKKSEKDYGKAFHWFITRYAIGNRCKTESEPLDAIQVNQLKSSGMLVGMSALFQLGRNFCIKKSAEYSDIYVNAVSTEFFGCTLERVYDAPLSKSVLCCFPITPLFLLHFLDRSTEDLNSQQKCLRSHIGKI